MAIQFAGFVYTTAGVAVNGATINIYDVNTTTPVRATTTTNSSGYWSISHATDGQFDVEVVSGSTTRRIKYNNQIQILRIETRNLTLDGSTSGRITQVAAAATTDYTITWPAAQGAASTYPQNNGSGALSWVTVSAAGVSRAGGQTTEATTTSTSAVDLITAASLSITGSTPFEVHYNGRKSSGAANDTACGLKLNTTVTGEASTASNQRGLVTTTTDRAENGGVRIEIGPRITNYDAFGLHRYVVAIGSTGAIAGNSTTPGLTGSALFPTATITDVIIRGISDDALNTLGVDELHVYSRATS